MTNEEFLRSISQEEEEWRDVVGFEGLYVVSNLGRVVRLSNPRVSANQHQGFTYIQKPKLLSLSDIYPKGYNGEYGKYKSVYLGYKKDRKRFPVHRLVAMAFIPNPDNLPQIDHIDGNRNNNISSNLRWCTPLQNSNHPIRIERIKSKLLGKPSKLSIPVVSILNGNAIKIYPSMVATLADGYSPMSVRAVCLGLRDIHKGLHWKFLSDYENLKSTMSKNSLEDRDV